MDPQPRRTVIIFIICSVGPMGARPRGYMMMVALLFFLGAGTIGFLSSWWFVWMIYGAVKVD